MKRTVSIGIGVLLLVALTGCQTVDLKANLEKQADFTGNAQKDYKVIRHFENEIKGYFTLFDLVTIQNPDIEHIIRSELKRSDGDAVINLKIQGQTTFLDGVIPALLSVTGAYLTLPYGYGSIAGSLISMRTFTVEGDVIRYTN